MVMIEGLWNPERLTHVVQLAEQKYHPEEITISEVNESTLRANMDWPDCVFHLPP